MSVKSRGTGIPLRGGGGGGGAIAVGNTDCDVTNQVNAQVSSLVIGDGLGFVAYQDPDNVGCVIIGAPPNFLPPFPHGVTTRANQPVRVGAPVNNEFFAGNNWQGTHRQATQMNTITWASGQCTGFGDASSMRVTVTNADGITYQQTTFPTAGNSDTTTDRIRMQVTGTTPDGDGSRDAATVRMTVDLLGLLTDHGVGHTSGSFVVSFLHTDFDGTTRTWSEAFFLDDSNNAEISLDADATGAREFHIENVNHASSHATIKYLSGIGYYTTGTQYILSSGTVHRHNLDSSRVNDSYVLDMDGFGVADYNTSPWTSAGDFQYMHPAPDRDRFDNQMAFIPDVTTNTINRANFRHIGATQALLNVRDAWGSSPQYASQSFNMLVDTFLDDSTALIETFNGEAGWRLEGDYTTAWDSELIRADGHGIVFGGGLYRGVDLPTIDENVLGGVGSLGDASAFFPANLEDNTVRVQPNYSGHTQAGVFFREFRATNPATSYANMSFTITTSNGLAADLASGGLRIYLWKLGSSAPSSPNLTLPPAYDPTDATASQVNSIWVHETYNFASFDDGATQSAATSGAQVNLTGSTVTVSFGGANVDTGVLARIEVDSSTTISHIVAAF
ncbi:hypothetical protein NVP1121O_026 [Vibrio phage 1.121.O._10N.286.46.C4]|nr:hypothetical protein NVP1121O_026 [Vibrio phage 1.121.O._10N.286.46.C4]